MKTRPLIGITPCYDIEKDKLYIANGYTEGINKAGGLAVLLPLAAEAEVTREALERCDGLLLSGGPDLDARHFGETNLRCNGPISPLRDSLELSAAKQAFDLNLPIFGICRGIQVLNVALGGTIYQDIYAQIKDEGLLKHSQEAPGWYPVHDVFVERGSRLWKCCGGERLGVNSFHHQSVKTPGKGLKVTAWSTDGVIEAVEHEGRIFTVGVQWHPELMWKADAQAMKLFEAFVEAAAERMER